MEVLHKSFKRKPFIGYKFSEIFGVTDAIVNPCEKCGGRSYYEINGKHYCFNAGRNLTCKSGEAISQKIDRNSICPCGSGKKYKKCCNIN